MSELKAYRVKGVTLGDTHDVYLKSEADKVIAELEESHKMEVEQLLMEIVKLKEERRWRKFPDELPEDGAEVLATDGEEIWLCHKDTMCDGSPWFQPDGLPHIEGVTHWMPLPLGPKQNGRECTAKLRQTLRH